MPPRWVTRRISESISTGSGTKFKTRPETAASTPSSASGMLAASATSNDARGSSIDDRATSRNVSDGSTPRIDAGSHRVRTVCVTAPVPHPTSTQRLTGRTSRRSMKTSATRRLHRPTYAS
jgi:hypothetical protein